LRPASLGEPSSLGPKDSAHHAAQMPTRRRARLPGRRAESRAASTRPGVRSRIRPVAQPQIWNYEADAHAEAELEADPAVKNRAREIHVRSGLQIPQRSEQAPRGSQAASSTRAGATYWGAANAACSAHTVSDPTGIDCPTGVKSGWTGVFATGPGRTRDHNPLVTTGEPDRWLPVRPAAHSERKFR
jgi:hypothetical protein